MDKIGVYDDDPSVLPIVGMVDFQLYSFFAAC